MSTTTLTFDTSGVTPDGWRYMPGVATGSTSASGAPVTGGSGDEIFLGPGALLLGPEENAPEAQITRLTIDCYLLAAFSRARIVLPYNDSDQFITCDVVRDVGGWARLEVRLTDASLGHDDLLIAVYNTAKRADVRGLFTVMAGPRMIRVWWHPSGARRSIDAPDLVAGYAEIDHMDWGLVQQASRTYGVAVETTPTADLSLGDRWSLEGDSETPDMADDEDNSTVVLAEYTAHAHARRRRGEMVVSVYDDDESVQAHTIMRRADPTRTLVLVPTSRVSNLGIGTLDQRVSSLTERGDLFADSSPSGIDGGIGSGRTSVGAGGELMLDPGLVLASTKITTGALDLVSDTGGAEGRDQAASRQRRSWDMKARLLPGEIRRLERVLAASGGTRGVWMVPPLEPEPVLVILPELSHTSGTPKKCDITMSISEI